MELRTAIYRFCNYQERSHQEVKDKLYELGANTDEVNSLLVELIEANLLNEERFARALVRGKFRQKHWGRIKIIQQLKQHRISPYLLTKSMTEIDPDEYMATAAKLAAGKWTSLASEKNPYIRRGKVFKYLQHKGYESEIISEVMQSLLAME